MRLTGIHIKSFRAIRDVTIDSVENALILVGQNNTGKSTIIDALRVALGDIAITKKDFNWDGGNIEIALTLELTKDDLKRLCRRGIISRYRKFDSWFEDFQKKLPSFVPIFETDGESINERGELSFCFIANIDGRKRYFDPSFHGAQSAAFIQLRIAYPHRKYNLHPAQRDAPPFGRCALTSAPAAAPPLPSGWPSWWQCGQRCGYHRTSPRSRTWPCLPARPAARWTTR